MMRRGLWTALGSKKNLQTGVPMRVLMAGQSFSPLYWRRVHNGLVDLVRQIGFPTIFFTMAPFEWAAPYHEFLKDAMQKLLRRRLHLAPFETLHLAHCMTQIVSGLITGKNKQYSNRGKGAEAWTKHVLSCKDETGVETVVQFYIRLEFQDGSRKEPTQAYHGSGRVHLHALIWLTNAEVIGLDKVISATAPGSTLGAYVRGPRRTGTETASDRCARCLRSTRWRLEHSSCTTLPRTLKRAAERTSLTLWTASRAIRTCS